MKELDDIFPKASPDFLRLNGYANIPVPADNSPPTAKSKRGLRNGPLAAGQAKKADSAFYVVRVTSFRSRLIDTDNLVAKWHVDALRYAGILPSDAPDKARIETSQVKCAKGEARTEILIEIMCAQK